ncbi:MAG: FtsX-like permease family protein [Acidimicrobiales bacterium]
MKREVVVLLTRVEVRRAWRALLGLALVVAVVGTVVLAAAAGARRTASALDRARVATAASDLRVQVDAEDAVVARVADALADSPAVADLARVRTFVVDGGGDFDLALVGDPDGRRGVTMDRPVALTGRLPAPDAPDEVALNENAAESLGLGVGDRLSLGTFSPDDVQALLTSDDFRGFNGPELDLQVVGVMRQLEDLQGGDTFAGPQALVGPAFFTEHADVGGFPEVFSVRLADPATGAADVERIVAGLAQDADVSSVDAADAYGESIGRAVDVLVVGLVVFTLIGAVAGLVVIGQAVSRQVQTASVDADGLRSLGVTRGARALAVGIPAATAAGVGALVAGAGSILVSPVFPIGLAGEVEAEQGLRVDGWVVVGGTLALIVVVVGLVTWRSWRQPAGAVDRHSPFAAAVGSRLGRRAVPLIGARLALDPGRGRRAVPVRSAVAGIAIGVFGIVGVGVVADSLRTLVDEPPHWGWTWSSSPDMEDQDRVRAGMRDDERLAGAAFLDQAYVDLGEAEATGFAVEPLRGEIGLAVRSGRLPAAPNEVALGHRTAEILDVGVGDTVRARTPDDGEAALTVVGEAVFPINDNASPGEGALLTPAGLDQVRASDGFASLLLEYPPGADAERLERELGEDYGLFFSAYSRPNLPGDVSNLDGARGVTVALGAFFAVLAVVGLAHALALSSRRRRVDFAVLRALGFHRGQVRRAVVVQALVITALGLTVGVPVGLVAGRVSWRLMVTSVGVIDDPTAPWGLLLLALPMVLVVVVAVAAGPAWASARRRPAAALRAE